MSLRHPVQLILRISRQKSCNRNKSVPAKVLARNTKTFAGTDLFPRVCVCVCVRVCVCVCVPKYRIVGAWFAGRLQLYSACDGRKGGKDSPCEVQKAKKLCDECDNRTRFCIWVKGTQSSASMYVHFMCWSVLQRHTLQRHTQRHETRNKSKGNADFSFSLQLMYSPKLW